MKRGIILLLTAMMLLMAFPVAAGAATAGSAHIVSSVSLRTGPGTSYAVQKYLKAGETVSVLEKTNDYWIKVKDGQGKTGYISASDKYVKLDQAQAPSGNGVAVGSVSFRKAPSTDGARIRYMKVGETFAVLSKVNAYWYEIRDNSGVVGYVSASEQYVKITGQAPSQPGNPQVPASQQVEKVIAAGKKYLGTPYEFGSDRGNTKTFDCSDFVRQAFKDALGLTLPSDSRQQGEYVRSKSVETTNWHNLKRGDLMFFMDYKGTKASLYSGKKPFSTPISHVGIYLGDGQILQTYSKESGGVRIDSIAGKHWEYRFLYGGSAL